MKKYLVNILFLLTLCISSTTSLFQMNLMDLEICIEEKPYKK